MFLLWHPLLTAINVSYTFPILETSATALCGTTGRICGNIPVTWCLWNRFLKDPSIFPTKIRKTRWWNFKHFYIHPDDWGNDPIWRLDFSIGLVQFNHQLDKNLRNVFLGSPTSFHNSWKKTMLWKITPWKIVISWKIPEILGSTQLQVSMVWYRSLFWGDFLETEHPFLRGWPLLGGSSQLVSS